MSYFCLTEIFIEFLFVWILTHFENILARIVSIFNDRFSILFFILKQTNCNKNDQSQSKRNCEKDDCEFLGQEILTGYEVSTSRLDPVWNFISLNAFSKTHIIFERFIIARSKVGCARDSKETATIEKTHLPLKSWFTTWILYLVFTTWYI